MGIAWQLLSGKLALGIGFSASGFLRSALSGGVAGIDCDSRAAGRPASFRQLMPPSNRQLKLASQSGNSSCRAVRSSCIATILPQTSTKQRNLRRSGADVENTSVRPARGMFGASSWSESTIRQGVGVGRRVRRSGMDCKFRKSERRQGSCPLVSIRRARIIGVA